jgi:polyisoprenoid-binding protein YceI
MKKITTFLAIFIVALTSAKIALAQDASGTENKYTIEKNHTSVMWIADHFGYSKVSGKFTDISGEIVFDEKKPQDSSVQVEIKTDSIATGLPKFEDHLKSKDFFDVKTFPTAKFVSKKIIVEGKKNKAQIIGDLTLLGVTKEVVLKAEFNKSSPNPMSQKPTIGFSAKTSINRSDFGIKYALPGVADKVELVIEVEANR